MARRNKHSSHPNHERWLVSYADFITLLFAFFTTMYALSTLDRQKAADFAASLARELGSIGQRRSIVDPLFPTDWRQTGTQPNHPPGGSKRPDRSLADLAQSLSRLAQSFGGDARFQVRLESRGVVLSLSEAMLFAPGDARLRRQSLPTLDALARILMQNPHPLIVEGHTDDRPGTLPSANWRLSVERAVTVLSYLVEEHGYPPTRLAAAGYGPYRPVAGNDTEADRARNRRVDIVILRSDSIPPEYRR
ncbi:MAG: flagellar motor protein MotB [Myxococcales bacterium]|nr:OmpA family protein [Myxococcota bacterium]MDW8282812.1 flagellar motor protein MotB [Myxococcales bacterium]